MKKPEDCIDPSIVYPEDYYNSNIMDSRGGQIRAVGLAKFINYGEVTITQNAVGKRNGEADTFYKLQLELKKIRPGYELPFIAWLQDKGYEVKQLENTLEKTTLDVTNRKYTYGYPANPNVDTQYTLMAALERDLKEIGARDASLKK